jgi:hypothetical protein
MKKIVQSANKKVSKWKGILSQNTNAKPWKWKICYKMQQKNFEMKRPWLHNTNAKPW